MKKMQDIIDGAKSIFDHLPEPVKAAILAGLIAFLRVVGDRRSGKFARRAKETLLCVLITWGVSKGAMAMGAPQEWGYLVGVAVGHLGTDYIREIARTWLDKKSKGE